MLQAVLPCILLRRLMLRLIDAYDGHLENCNMGYWIRSGTRRPFAIVGEGRNHILLRHDQATHPDSNLYYLRRP